MGSWRNGKKIQAKRKQVWETYHEGPKDWAQQNCVIQPHVPEYCDHAYHIYYLLMPSLEARQAFITHLKQQGILSVFHYLPLHLSGMGVKYGGQPGDCPVTEDMSDRLVRLPMYEALTWEEICRICDSIGIYHVS